MAPAVLHFPEHRSCARPHASQRAPVRCQHAAPAEVAQPQRRAARQIARPSGPAPEAAPAKRGRLEEGKRALQSLVQAPWQHGFLARRRQDDAAAPAAEGGAAQGGRADPLDPTLAGQGDAGGPANTILPLPRGVWRRRGAKSPPRTPPPPQAEHPALEAVKARWLGGSRPGARRDDFKVGLVVEGGGMRGVVSGGALQAMHDLGMRDAFDAVYGSSAGAINATYFLSGQRDGVSIYREDIANDRFVSLRRLVPRRGEQPQRPALDLGFLLNDVMQHAKPLDWAAVLASPVPLKVVASCLDTLQPIILEDFKSAADLSTCLRASANVPEARNPRITALAPNADSFTCLRASAKVLKVAGGPVEHRGLRLVDAAVFEPVPFRAAIADGCTHVLALCTRPPYMPGRLTKMVDDFMTTAIKRAVMNPAYMRAAWEQEAENIEIFGATVEDMLIEALNPESYVRPYFAGTHVYPAFPGAAASFISPVCTDVGLLEKGEAEGRAMVMRLFADGREPEVAPPGPPAVATPLAGLPV